MTRTLRALAAGAGSVLLFCAGLVLIAPLLALETVRRSLRGAR